MTTITIERELLDRVHRYLNDRRLFENACDRRKRNETNQEHSDRISSAMQRNEDLREFIQEVESALAAPATEPKQAFVCSLGCADECLARLHGCASECPSLPQQPATTAENRHAQELLAQDITIANMRERHAQELCAYELTVANLRAEFEEAQKDAARYRWLAAYARSTSEHWYGPLPEDKP